MLLKTLVVTNFATNCYLVGCPDTRQGMVIDPGGNARAILAAVKELGLTVKYIVNTHGHIDHIAANQAVLEATGAALVAHRLEAPLLTDPKRNLGFLLGHFTAGPAAGLLVEDGDIISVGTIRFQVLHTPGHSPGGISLYNAEQGLVFCGDALFKGGIGRTDFAGGDHDLLIQSITSKLLTLPDETLVYPGHGPETTIGYEKVHNPWLR